MVACLALVEATFRAAHLLTEVVYFVTGKVSGAGLSSALFVVLGHHRLHAGSIFDLENGYLFRALWHKCCPSVSRWRGDTDGAAWIKMAIGYSD